MNKQAMITDSAYIFVEENSPIQTVTTSNISPEIKDNIKVQLKPAVKTTAKTVVQSPVTSQKSQAKPQSKTVVKTVQNTKNTTAKPVVKPKQQQAAKPAVVKTTVKNTTAKTPVKTPAKSETKTAPPPQKTVPAVTPKTKVLTESEEIIAWNKWRSELQNQVMRDTKIGAPMGTAFRFSFTVDKFGNMSNIKVWSTNPVYTDLGVRVIKPILASYQNKPILNFPENTKRVITNVTGGFYISTTTQYSKPSDYSDYEKVKKVN